MLTTPIQVLAAGGADAPAAFDTITAAAESAVGPLVAALARGRSVPYLSAALCALQLGDPLATFGPLLAHGSDEVAGAAVTALGVSGDVRALPLLHGALERHELFAIDAIACLGDPAGVTVLREFAKSRLTALADSTVAEMMAGPGGQMILDEVAAIAGALARLGDPSLATEAIEIATTTPADGSGGLVRLRAVTALQSVVAPGVAAALRAAAHDHDEEVAEEGIRGLLCMGRIDDVDELVALASSGVAAARRAVSAWAGAPAPEPLARWWAGARAGFEPGTSYRNGQLASPGVLIEQLASRGPGTLRIDLAILAGPRGVLVDLGFMRAMPGEIARLRVWWAAHGAELPAGRLHRSGRSYPPSAVD